MLVVGLGDVDVIERIRRTSRWRVVVITVVSYVILVILVCAVFGHLFKLHP